LIDLEGKAGDSGSPGIAVVQQSEFTHLCGRFKPIMAWAG
jgi:hypothetical protein